MRLPRDVSGADLAKALRHFGYEPTRQTGSHLRVTTQRRGTHHLTVPLHDELKVGTLAGIVADVATHLDLPRDEIVQQLFGNKGAVLAGGRQLSGATKFITLIPET